MTFRRLMQTKVARGATLAVILMLARGAAGCGDSGGPATLSQRDAFMGLSLPDGNVTLDVPPAGSDTTRDASPLGNDTTEPPRLDTVVGTDGMVEADSVNPADGGLPDGDDPPDAPEPTDVGPDTTEGPSLVVRHSGENGCTLDYVLQLITNCPKACGWTFEIEAVRSLGIDRVDWRFSVDAGYTVSPATASGFSTAVTVGMPDCAVFTANRVGPGQVTVEASVNDGPLRVVKRIDFGVRQVLLCADDSMGSCRAP